MEKKFKVLRVIGTIYKVLGIIVGVISILLALGICLTSILGSTALNELGRELGGDTNLGPLFGGFLGGAIVSLGAIIYGGSAAITLYAAGELVFLLLSLEENTRMTASLLQKNDQ